MTILKILLFFTFSIQLYGQATCTSWIYNPYTRKLDCVGTVAGPAGPTGPTGPTGPPGSNTSTGLVNHTQTSNGSGGFLDGNCTQDGASGGANQTCVGDNPLASTSLTNGSLTGGTNWEFNADFSSVSNNAVYTRSVGTGYVRQQLSSFAIPSFGNRWYEFTYTTSANTGTAPSCVILDTFAISAVALPLIGGSHTVAFLSTPTPTIFTIECDSSTSGSVTFDDFFLQEMLGGSLNIGGQIGANQVNVTGTIIYNKASPPANSVVCYKAGGVMGWASNTSGVIGTTCN